MLGSLLAVGVLILGILVVTNGGRSSAPPAAPGTSSPASAPTVEPSTPIGPSATPSRPATTTVMVYFHSAEKLVLVTRRVPLTQRVATAALRQLLAGPTAAEREAGTWSWFSARTAGMLRSVRVADGVAYADFSDLRPVIPNASTSGGSAALLGELDATLMQFRTVQRTVYSLDGDVAAFYGWLQLAPPPGVQRS
ncbi:MAG TPA: GerMN domain-containing protein [Mycobacteriales bacterium]